MKKQYIITIESKTIEVYAESIAEALSLGGLNDETMANARLIAAAPDLLLALERLVHPMADDEDLDYAREVIANAKGCAL